MSYCRFSSHSDLYLIAMMDGFECLNCKLVPEEYTSWHGADHQSAYEHILEHHAHGHNVPADAFRRLIAEIGGIPWKSQQHEFEDLMEKLAAPNSTMNEFMQTVRTANAKRLAAMMDEFADALCDLDNLEWPPEDEFDD